MKFETDICNGFFGRHETFTPRYGWLKKGYDGVKKNPNIFNSPDAIEELGVGKNMVKSILFWSLATHIVEPVDAINTPRIGGTLKTSQLGDKLLCSKNGWDPYLEDPASFWLLHWELCMPTIYAAAWPLALNNTFLKSFDLKILTQTILIAKNELEKLKKYSEASIKKDASCFIRTYSSKADDENKENEIECPFTQLNLINLDKDGNHKFNFNHKSNLPPLIFLAACIKFSHHTQINGKTISLKKISYAYNSPCMVFKISETQAGTYIEEAVKHIDEIEFVELQGNRQLQFERDSASLYLEILERYYAPKSN